MLTAENWCVKVDDKIYGPYSTPQMRKFAHEGRLAAWSLISPAGARAWCEAGKEAAFASFFGMEREAASPASGAVFGKRSYEYDNDDVAEQKPEPARKPSLPLQADTGVANFIIVFDVVSGAASRVEAAIISLGAAFRIADNVWSVACELTAVGVRNAIAPYLSGRESIFVIDATRGRTSWQNYAPEPHAKISAAYLMGAPCKSANSNSTNGKSVNGC